MQWEARVFLVWAFLAFILVGEVSLEASERLSLSRAGRHPEELEKLQGHEVKVRGFLYPKAEGWILAGEPNLRSCCVGASHKRGSQLVIASGEIPDVMPLRAVTLGGTLRKAENEAHEERWELAEAFLEVEPLAPWPWILGAAAGVLFMLWGFRRVCRMGSAPSP